MKSAEEILENWMSDLDLHQTRHLPGAPGYEGYIDLIQRARKEALEQAQELCFEHRCNGYPENCHCGGAISDEIRALINQDNKKEGE